MVTSECYRHIAATIAAAAGQVFHCPESRSDSRAARSCHHPPAPCALEFAPPPPKMWSGAEGGWKGCFRFPADQPGETSFAFISAALSVPRSRPREKGFRAAGFSLFCLPRLGLIRDVPGFARLECSSLSEDLPGA